jgi:hypothetical protein
MGRLAAVDISLGAASVWRRGVVGGAGRGAASYGVTVRNSPIATISLTSAPADRNDEDDNNLAPTDYEPPPCPCGRGSLRIVSIPCPQARRLVAKIALA